MFLGAFHFDGRLDEVLPAYERMLAGYPPESLELHICVEREGGITVYDACPSRAVFDQFTASDQFRTAITAAGLPRPHIEPVGEVHTTRVREPVAGSRR